MCTETRTAVFASTKYVKANSFKDILKGALVNSGGADYKIWLQFFATTRNNCLTTCH